MNESIGHRIGLVIDATVGKKVRFAEQINVDQSYVTRMVSGGKIPSDRVIKDICEAFNVSEHWLRTGEGDMFLPKPESSLPAELTSDPLIRAILEAYLDLDPQSRQTFQRFFADVVTRYNGNQPALSIDAAVDQARAAESPSSKSQSS